MIVRMFVALYFIRSLVLDSLCSTAVSVWEAP